MAIKSGDVPRIVEQLIAASARLQARHDMLECIVHALIVETPAAHPLWWKALDTGRSEWGQRSANHPAGAWPALDAAALALWNELRGACAPPSDHDS